MIYWLMILTYEQTHTFIEAPSTFILHLDFHDSLLTVKSMSFLSNNPAFDFHIIIPMIAMNAFYVAKL